MNNISNEKVHGELTMSAIAFNDVLLALRETVGKNQWHPLRRLLDEIEQIAMFNEFRQDMTRKTLNDYMTQRRNGTYNHRKIALDVQKGVEGMSGLIDNGYIVDESATDNAAILMLHSLTVLTRKSQQDAAKEPLYLMGKLAAALAMRLENHPNRLLTTQDYINDCVGVAVHVSRPNAH